jgi:hypothetical protein
MGKCLPSHHGTQYCPVCRPLLGIWDIKGPDPHRGYDPGQQVTNKREAEKSTKGNRVLPRELPRSVPYVVSATGNVFAGAATVVFGSRAAEAANTVHSPYDEKSRRGIRPVHGLQLLQASSGSPVLVLNCLLRPTSQSTY